jgi:hypothetical protein
MLSRLSRNLSRRGESLDLQIPQSGSREKAVKTPKQGIEKIWPLSGQPIQAASQQG